MCNGFLIEVHEKGESSSYDVDPLSNIETVQNNTLNRNENTSVASQGLWIVVDRNVVKIIHPKNVIPPWLYQLRVERLKVKQQNKG